MSKFEAQGDNNILLGYSSNDGAYRVFNKQTRIIIEFINVVVNDMHVKSGAALTMSLLTMIMCLSL